MRRTVDSLARVPKGARPSRRVAVSCGSSRHAHRRSRVWVRKAHRKLKPAHIGRLTTLSFWASFGDLRVDCPTNLCFRRFRRFRCSSPPPARKCRICSGPGLSELGKYRALHWGCSQVVITGPTPRLCAREMCGLRAWPAVSVADQDCRLSRSSEYRSRQGECLTKTALCERVVFLQVSDTNVERISSPFSENATSATKTAPAQYESSALNWVITPSSNV